MSESDPVPGGRPGEVERATALSGELSGQGVHGVVLSYVDTAGIGRVKTVPTAKLASATAWGVGMSPVFDTFLADDTIVATDVQGLAGLLQERGGRRRTGPAGRAAHRALGGTGQRAPGLPAAGGPGGRRLSDVGPVTVPERRPGSRNG